MKRIAFLLIAIVLSGISFSQAGKENQKTDNGDPFKSGSAQRDDLVIISDLHMGADLAYSELNNNIKLLAKFLKDVRASGNVKELVIAGDLMDEWFVPADLDTYAGKGQGDFVQRVGLANKAAVDVLNSIISDGNIKVTYVPGNHDLTITPENIEKVFPGINQARDKESGLGTYTPDSFPVLAVEHGHRYNFFCAPDMISNQDIAPGTIMPPGYFFTRIAALHVRQKCTKNIDAIPTLSPNVTGDKSQALLYGYSKVWAWALGALPINNHFNEDLIVTNVNGFTGSFKVNDLFPFQASPGGMIDMKLYKGIQDTWDARQTNNHVAVHIPADHAIAFSSSADETDNLAISQYFTNPGSDKRIVVFGHNHRATIIPFYNNGKKYIYANSGTWIDHNPGSPTATFLIIKPRREKADSLTSVEVFSFEGQVYTRMAMNSLRL